jgi:hypothetical protein
MLILPTLPLEFSLLLYGIIMHALELLVWYLNIIIKFIFYEKPYAGSDSTVLLAELRVFEGQLALPPEAGVILCFRVYNLNNNKVIN